MVRLFKPGERVMFKSGGPVMEVIKYITEESPVLGQYMSDSKVECVWFEPGKGRCTGTFHQNSLIRVSWQKSHTFSREYEHKNATLYGSFKNMMNELSVADAQTTANLLADAIAYLSKQGYKTEFLTTADGLMDLQSKKVYSPEEMSIVKVFQFDGYTHVDDMSVLYAIQTDDGKKGWIADAYGVYANPKLAEQLGRMKDART